MMPETIDHLIINSPYEKPRQHWEYDRERRFFNLVDGRRPAGYLASSGQSGFDDPGIFHELPLVNKIRKRVDAWRERHYPGVTGITKKLLEYWNSPEERDNRFFFCQMEAIETLIWLKEAPESEKQGIDIPSDGGSFLRLCCKMATGAGKTIVMGMLIAWHVLNKVAYPNDARFSKRFLVVAPGLTVKRRLEVLDPYAANNIYTEFKIIPHSLFDNLRQAKIVIHNWHVLMPLEENPTSVVKKGKESDEAFTRRILGHDSTGKNIIVINDEAHHAWRIRPEQQIDVSEEQLQEATQWMEGLDRIHKTRNIMTCFDFSATPFIPTGRTISEETLYDWIVSDFSLNDAIESGLVKTPRVAIRDDGRFSKDYHSRFYHIYIDPEVKGDISRKAKPEEPLPDLVKNAYFVLGKDWLETKNLWEEKESPVPPVMITVCNRTETAARIEYSFVNKRFEIDELADSEKMLHIDSKVLKEAESKDSTEDIENGERVKISLKDKGEQLREEVATVGKVGKAGQNVQNIVAVAMLSEGWDARTVTHIMGLRAFTSQLLCEQVVGRGLRRTSYEVSRETGLFEPEYVNVFGIPFTFLPVEGAGRTVPLPPKPSTYIEPYTSKKQHELSWPNIVRIDRTYSPKLSLDWGRVEPLTINPEDSSLIVDLAPVIDGKPHVDKISTIDIEKLGKKFRLQTSIFKITRDIYEKFKPDWKGNKEYLMLQLVNLVEEFLKSGKIIIANSAFQDDLRKRVLISLNMSKIVHHIWSVITFHNIESVALVFDKEKPIRSTSDMMPWYTTKANEYTKKSHVSHAVVDSRWELSTVFELERNENVQSWVKNDHLGFDISYVYEGVVHKYWPDFLIRLKNGTMLVLEIKGEDSEKDRTKRKYLDEWIKAVNQDARFAKWSWDVAFAQSEVRSIIRKHSESSTTEQNN
jgi:type III restriction enzyme